MEEGEKERRGEDTLAVDDSRISRREKKSKIKMEKVRAIIKYGGASIHRVMGGLV